ncbi:MAG TPA: hypothetical protein GX704_04430 [Clostridiales bacterium]|nr:hypothetical protein [Clostridiales bacterium]
MKKHLHTLRVAYENWLFEDRFYGLTELLKKYDTGITDIALFTSIVHTPLTIEENQRRADIIANRIKYLKSEGYFAGINILATIGHHHEDLDNMLKGPYQMMVGADGTVSPATFCMNDESFLSEYAAVIYDIYARTGADFIWVDDDVRYGHMPIGNGCFCDLCIGKFNRENNYSFDRPGLIAELENGDVEFRRKWLRQNRETLSRLLSVAGKAVRNVDENIMLGFMTGERYIESYDFHAFSEALSDGGKHEIMWRPGGGAYNDFSFDYIVAKSEQIGRQNAYLPPYVTINHSEVENFPYNLINKTPKSTAAEAMINMTVGCTGGAFNILPSETLEPIENIAPHLKAIADIKLFYLTLQEVTAGLSPAGIHTGWRIDAQAAVPLVSGYGGGLASYSRELFFFGLPECYNKDKASVVTLTGDSAKVMDDDEILKILSGGVYLNAAALNYLNERGFGEYTGFAVKKSIPADARENYTDEKINDGFAFGFRNCRQAFFHGDSFALTPMADDCRVLSELVDYHGKVLADCACGIFENSLGGRICAAGYYPHNWISDYNKTVQLKRVFTWLSKYELPSYVTTYCRIRNITLTGDGRQCVTLFNTSNDDIGDLSVMIKTSKCAADVYMMSGERFSLECGEKTDEGYKCYTISNLKPYEMAVIVT